MMCNTAAIQVNVGLGDPDQVVAALATGQRAGADAHRLLRQLPLRRGAARAAGSRAGCGPGGRSTRPGPQPVRCDVDPVRGVDRVRTRRPGHARPHRRRALRARARAADASATGCATATSWAGPTDDDLGYHLTTLFPPVRPKGWLELRMFDALPSPLWQVAVAVTGALLRDPALAIAGARGRRADHRPLGRRRPAGPGPPRAGRARAPPSSSWPWPDFGGPTCRPPASTSSSSTPTTGCARDGARLTTASTRGARRASCSRRPSRHATRSAGHEAMR